MASYHREVYQPSFEDGPTYDLQDDEVEDARARLPLLIVIALYVLVVLLLHECTSRSWCGWGRVLS